MHGTCNNRSMLITTCTTLKAHLQPLVYPSLGPRPFSGGREKRGSAEGMWAQLISTTDNIFVAELLQHRPAPAPDSNTKPLSAA